MLITTWSQVKKGLVMSKVRPLFRVRNVIQDEMMNQRRYLLGRVLTIVDASIPDAQQRKAVKDLVNDVFWENMPSYRVCDVLAAFAEKYCKEESLKDEESRKEFFANGPAVGGIPPEAREDYFA